MSKNQKKPPVSWALAGVFVVVSSLILITGSVYIRNQKRNTLEIKKEELNAYANIKAGQIVRWWHERVGNAIIIKENYPLVEEIDYFLKNPDRKQKKESISHLLGSIVGTFDYQNAIILDNEGRVRLAIPESDSIIEHYMDPLIPIITAGRKVTLTELHRVSPEKPAQLDLVIPLEIVQHSEVRSIGTIIMRLDPEKLLYPIVSSWPTRSKTSETLLLRKEGDSVSYLNVLRHLPVQPLTVKRAIADTNLLGSKAVRGFTGVFNGVDYRGVEVLGAVKRIAGSGWYMVSKVDMKEINDIINGEATPVRLLIILMLTAFGSVIGWFIWHQRVRFYRDSYEAELEKMMLRKHFDYILKYANDIILLMDTDLNIVETNDHALEVYQYSREEMINADLRILRLPGSDAELNENLKNLQANRASIYETIHRRKDGTTFPVEISARVFEIEGIKYYQSIGRDMTERKKAERLLQETEKAYSGLFHTVSDAIYIHKTDGIFMDVNNGAVKMYGYPREEMIGMSPAVVGAPGKNDLEKVQSILDRVFETGKSEQFEFWGLRKNGEIFPKEVVVNKGSYFGQDVIISTARDITLRKNYEDQLRFAKEKAEESDRLKTAFLHNISHEIRTPMNAIVGFTALLDEPDIEPDTRKHFINIIYQSTSQLLNIISDIVDISNIETGQVKLTISEVNINTIIFNLYEQYKLTADQQKVLFHYEAKMPDDKAVIHTDKTKLIQIISNLLNNAFKFTRQGTVQFGYHLNGPDIEFFVRDTGIGVPPEKQDRIFDRFYQIDNDSARQYGGAGLGLSISKAYIELLGGKIWLESKPGKGSEFRFLFCGR